MGRITSGKFDIRNLYEQQQVQGQTDLSECAQPHTVACKTEAPSEHVHNAYTFLHAWRRLVCLVGDYRQNSCIGAQEEVY